MPTEHSAHTLAKKNTKKNTSKTPGGRLLARQGGGASRYYEPPRLCRDAGRWPPLPEGGLPGGTGDLPAAAAAFPLDLLDALVLPAGGRGDSCGRPPSLCFGDPRLSPARGASGA